MQHSNMIYRQRQRLIRLEGFILRFFLTLAIEQRVLPERLAQDLSFVKPGGDVCPPLFQSLFRMAPHPDFFLGSGLGPREKTKEITKGGRYTKTIPLFVLFFKRFWPKAGNCTCDAYLGSNSNIKAR